MSAGSSKGFELGTGQDGKASSSDANASHRPKCYNCGAYDHYLVTCPEPARAEPEGLKAARAAKAAQEAAPSKQQRQNHRKFSSHKHHGKNKGPIVTRYAPPQYQSQPNGPLGPPPQGYDQGSYGYNQFPNQQPHQDQWYAQEQSYSQGQPYPPPQPYPHGQPFPQAQTYPQGPSYPPAQSFAQPPQSYSHPPYYPQQGNGYPPYSGGPHGSSPPPPSGYPPHSAAWQDPRNQYPPHQAYGPQPPPYSPQSASPTLPPGAVQGYPSGAHHSFGQPPSDPYQHAQHHPYPQDGQPFPDPQPHPHWNQPVRSGSDSRGPYYGPHDEREQPRHPPYSEQYSERRSSSTHHSPPSNERYATPQYHGARYDASAANTISKESPPYHTGDKRLDNGEAEDDWQWEFDHIFLEENHEPANQVAHPLPAPGSDDPFPVPIQQDRAIASKYINRGNMEFFKKNVRETARWEKAKCDPVFSEISFNGKAATNQDLRAYMAQRDFGLVLEESEEEPGAEPEPAQIEGPQSGHKRSRRDSNAERPHLQQGQAQHHQKTTFKRQRLDSTWSSKGGPEKPIQQPSSRNETPPPNSEIFSESGPAVDPWAPQPGEEPVLVQSPFDEPEQEPTTTTGGINRGSIHRKGDIRPYGKKRGGANFQGIRKPPPVSHNGHPRQDSGYSSSRGSYNTKDDQAFGHQPPPPPPPPPYGHVAYSEGHGRSAHPEVGPPGPRTNFGPSRAQSKNTEPRRQQDDVTPKHKRRQPRVANAYERRW